VAACGHDLDEQHPGLGPDAHDRPMNTATAIMITMGTSTAASELAPTMRRCPRLKREISRNRQCRP
jgi:hypothetical protein